MRVLIGRLHRYLGLATALFLAVAGLTGSALAFYHELDEWLNPGLFRVAAGGQATPPLALAERIERDDPRLFVTWVPLDHQAGHSLELGVAPRADPASGTPHALGYDQLFVDPASGAVLGERQWGACCLERPHLMPFLYSVHYSLHLPGNWGIWLMGIVGLVWVFDCFFGLYLTLPARRRGGVATAETGDDDLMTVGTNDRTFWRRWRSSWRIKRDAGAWRINFDLHRAGGLWCWGLLLMLAVSSVSFNLHEEVFEPVVNAISPLTPSPFDTREERAAENMLEPTIPLATMVATANERARRRGWSEAASGIFYNPLYGIYGVRFGRDHEPGLGNEWLYFDGASGEPLGAHLPGEGSAGDIFHRLQYPLHSGQILGLPGRILICVTGLAVATLSITGVMIWCRKRRALTVRSGRRARTGAAVPLME
ncbi:MAG: hypothetical protein NFCOHLIN_00425 [Gammaproteobacteria bacterium]|nr:hypothetical protein [Gammaproteobacteria bacterium]